MKHRAWGALALGCAGLVLASTWPAAPQLGTHLIPGLYDADVQGALWWFPACAEAITEGRSPFLRDELVWPIGQDTRLLVWNTALSILLAPVTLLVDNPIARLNLSALLLVFLNGIAGGLLGHRLGGKTGAWAAMIVTVGAHYGFIEGGSGRMEQGFYAPVLVYLGALHALREAPGSRRWRLIAAASLALGGSIYWFYAYFLVFLTIGCAGVWLVLGRLSRQGFLDLAAVGLGSLLFVSPFLVPVVLGQLAAPDFYGAMADAAGSVVTAQSHNALPFPAGFVGPGIRETPYPTHQAPLLMVPLCLAAVFSRRLRLLGGLGLVSAVLAAGPLLILSPELISPGSRPPRLALPHYFLNELPGFSRLWWPYRWQAIGLSAAALSAAGLLGGLRRGWLALPPLALWSVVEVHAALHGGILNHTRAPMTGVEVPQIFRDIGASPGTHPILHFPQDGLPNSMMGLIPWHNQPIDGGMAWGRPEVHSLESRQRDETTPLLAALGTLQRTGALPELPEPLTEADTAGFRYLAMYHKSAQQRRGQYTAALSSALGEPIFQDQLFTVWQIPHSP